MNPIHTQIASFVEVHFEEYIQLICELTAIPAPSLKEEKRGRFLLACLKKLGYEQAFVDEAGNVICEIEGYDCGKGDQSAPVLNDARDDRFRKPLYVYCAHQDTVFPDEDPVPVRIADGRIYGPGVGDDTANICALLMTLRFMKETDYVPSHDLLFVFNTGEEGLGNLKGTKAIIKRYGHRIARFVSYDLGYDALTVRAVGSRRFRVRIRTEGGHSYGAFGKANAIAAAAACIQAIYSIDTTDMPGKTTYNVGTIQGGTSINTIAQDAVFTCEYRSDDRKGMAEIGMEFDKIFDRYGAVMSGDIEEGIIEDGAVEVIAKKGITIEGITIEGIATRGESLDKTAKENMKIMVTVIGERPSMGEVDEAIMEEMTGRAEDIIRHYAGFTPRRCSTSTDCNVPLSMGIPAISFGVYLGGGTHTREEYIEISSLKAGLCIGMGYILDREH